MVHGEAVFSPTGTTQIITTDETEFANALFYVAGQAGYDISLIALENNVSQLEFRGEDEDVTHLFRAAQNQQDVWFWREMGGYDITDEVLAECELAEAA